MNKKLIIVVFSVIGALTSTSVNAQLFNEHGLKFMKLFGWIESQYVDSINLDKLSDNAIKELLHTLDPHSVYFNKDEVREMNEPLQGNFEGIGISYTIYKDTILIVSCSPDGPSVKAGVLPGDRIIQINTEKVAGIGITRQEVQNKLRGSKGSNVNISVLRRGENNYLSFSLTRDKILIKSIDASYKINDKTGYIRLSRFSATSKDELTTVFTEFISAGIENLILDLSGNTGGYLDIAVSFADEFLDKEKLIVYTVGSHNGKKEFFSTSNGLFEKGKLVIIINENSASASEIVAGAVQDWDRGIIVGRRSYGKGLVQRPFTFSDGSMIRLTVARYYTPSGRLIQKPYSDGYQAYNKELANRVKTGEIYGNEKLGIKDTVKYYTLLKRRIVYGGGGISPDVYVPIDTAKNSPLLRILSSKGIFGSFALHYIDFRRGDLKVRYPDFIKFKKEFKVDNNIISEFILYCNDQKIKVVPAEFEKSKEQIILAIKANIASEIFSSGAFYEIINTTNPDFIKAEEVISNWDKYFKS